jgi:ABC-type uncharacterized transport system ATPase subunit
MDFIAELANRVICLKAGQVLFDGTKEAFFSEPALLQEANLKEPEIVYWVRKLREKGVPLPSDIFDLDSLVRALEKAN